MDIGQVTCMCWVYILKSVKTNRYYIGSTNNLERRIREHTEGKSKYIRNQLPIILVYSQEYITLLEARQIEKKLKQYKSKKIIEQIIKDGYIKRR